MKTGKLIAQLDGMDLIELDGWLISDGERISPIDAYRVFGISIKDILNKCYPSRTEANDGTGGYYLRMYYGNSTGVFYREMIGHEYRIGCFPDGYELAVSTKGGFNIWPLTRKFDTYDEALQFLNRNKARLDSHDLDLKTE